MKAPREILLTCGPSFASIDAVRRITNASTGRLGTVLADAFSQEGCAVKCFRGEGATFPPPAPPVEVIPFTTNADLLEKLAQVSRRSTPGVHAILHAAALTDFEVQNSGDRVVGRGKWDSRNGEVLLRLTPAPKILPQLRPLFPHAVIVGWKYEVEGSPADTLVKVRRQFQESAVDWCVLNGPAYGSGFGIYAQDGTLSHCPNPDSLAQTLLRLVKSGRSASIS